MSRRLRVWAFGAGTAALATAAISLTGVAGASTPAPRAATPVASPTPAPTVAPIPRNGPIAVVAGQQVSSADYTALVTQERAAAAMQAQQGGAVPSERQVRTQALNDIVNTAIIAHYAQQHGIKVASKEIDQRYNATKTGIEQQARQSGQSITFAAVLKRYGYTEASYKKALADAIVGSRVEQRIAPAALVEAVRARHILIGPPLSAPGAATPTAKSKPDAYYKAIAETIYKQLQQHPERFAALAKQKSIDTGSGVQGGELGWFVKGMMVPPFEKAAFSLPIGRISTPIKSQFGYHIIQVEEHKKVPFTTLPRSALQTPSVQALAQQRQTTFAHWLNTERARDHVHILYKP